MAPFITPTITPQQQAQRLAQRETEVLLTKLTREQVAHCDRRGRRGSAMWREAARSFLTRKQP